MDFCIINDENIIENIIVCEDEETAATLGAVPGYEQANIGDIYDPPEVVPEPTQEERIQALEAENTKLKAQATLQAEQLTILEDCILELGDTIYA